MPLCSNRHKILLSRLHNEHWNVGCPATPMFGELISSPGAGEVTIMIKTVASGLDDPSQVFWFVITPYTDDIEGETVPHLVPNYQSGTFATIVMTGLEQGERYRFNATATNIFGASGLATSSLLLLVCIRIDVHNIAMCLSSSAWLILNTV